MAPETHTLGSRVWVKDEADPEAVWQRGDVERVCEGGSLFVRTEKGGEVTAGPDAFPLQNLDALGVEV